MIEPTTDDVGRRVVYRPTWHAEARAEPGVITSISEAFVFVRYGLSGPGVATRREDLFWET